MRKDKRDMRKWMWLIVALISLASADVLIFSPVHMKYPCYVPDDLLGWAPKHDFAREFVQRDSAGKTYKAFFALDHNGFREYGDPAAKRIKILFLGDSYTGDPNAGNQEIYFSVVKSTLHNKYNLDVEIFAAGGGGYGTLQQYLFIKEYIPKIKPDVFVLQFCDNDFENNYWEWEKYSIVRNQKYFRPYYSIESDSIFYADTFTARYYRIFYKNSFLFRGFEAILRRLQYKYYNGYSKLTAQENYQFLRTSYPVTKKLLQLLRNEFGKETSLFAFFPPPYDPPFENQSLSVLRECGFTPLLSPMHALEKARNKGEIVLNADGGHYNNLGNRILGEALAAELYSHLKNQGKVGGD